MMMRATRRNCRIPILLHSGERVYPTSIVNISFTGAFVEGLIPVTVGETATVEFQDPEGSVDLRLEARIIRATDWGIGIQFMAVRSKASRFLQKCLDKYR
jgi:hypothetical protein